MSSLSSNIRLALSRIKFAFWLKKQRKLQEQERKRVKAKEKKKVLFLVIQQAIWKYDVLLELLKADDRFEPEILVCPYTAGDEEELQHEMNKVLRAFSEKGVNVINSRKADGTWIDVRTDINPDIIFFTNPHKLTRKEYTINQLADKLTCYTPYAFVVIGRIEMHYNDMFHKMLWKHYIETETHRKYALSFPLHNEHNLVVSGYPALDKVFQPNTDMKHVWKSIEGKERKKIIWAPHHTIKGQGVQLDYSSFEELADFFLKLAESEGSDYQFAFKPHPLLMTKLFQAEAWGKEKTLEYYKRWENATHGQLETGDYLDLFQESDGMILDSASFIVEYLYFNKPVLFTYRDKDVKERFNSFGQEVLNVLYSGAGEADILAFLEERILKEKDTELESRKAFLRTRILPQNGFTASENIFQDLIEELC